ncbi:MAG: M20/M25/M40 family metallo-hydrolase, partial [Dehalococcoidia bacterium]
ESAPGRGSFIARLGEGAGPAPKSLLYLSHTDVVPATEGWDFPPFCGEIRDGFVLGRGALDCKGLVAAQAHAILHLARHSRLQGRLIFAATADEEAGGANGVHYLLENHAPKLTADFAINEGAGEPLRVGEEVAYFVQVGEKGPAWTTLRAKGVSCHGSVPGLGDNAVARMARAVAGLADYRPQIVLIPEVRDLLQGLARMKGVDEEVNEQNVERVIDLFEERAFAEYLRAITRMTVAPTMMQGGSKVNIVPDSAQADVDIRVLPGQDRGFVLAELRKLVEENIEVDIPVSDPPTFSPSDSPHYRLIQDTLRGVVGDVACLPSISSGATDSRYLRRKGIPAYGVSIMSPNFDPSLRETIHGKNERIDLESLKLSSQFFISLAESYLSG